MIPNLNLSSCFGRCRLMRPDRLLQISESLRTAANLGTQVRRLSRAADLLLSQKAISFAEAIQLSEDETPERGLLWLAGGKNTRQQGKAVAVVPISGMIDQKRSWMMDLMGGTSTDDLGATIDALVADTGVKGIILDVDSPGGTSLGLQNAADKIFAARKEKPIVAVVNSEMDSAGYWLGSSASMIFADQGSVLGSIGVWSAVAEYSEQLKEDGVNVLVTRSTGSPYKAEFLPFAKFSQEAVANEQVEVDKLYAEFVAAVARNRGVTASRVRSDYGKGRSMGARDAVAAGLADRIASLEDVVRKMDAGRLTLGVLNDPQAMAAEFPVVEYTAHEAWRDENATEQMRSRLRRQGILS